MPGLVGSTTGMLSNVQLSLRLPGFSQPRVPWLSTCTHALSFVRPVTLSVVCDLSAAPLGSEKLGCVYSVVARLVTALHTAAVALGVPVSADANPPIFVSPYMTKVTA